MSNNCRGGQQISCVLRKVCKIASLTALNGCPSHQEAGDEQNIDGHRCRSHNCNDDMKCRWLISTGGARSNSVTLL